MTSLFALAGFEQALANALMNIPSPPEAPSEFPAVFNELAAPDSEPTPVIRKKEQPVAQLAPQPLPELQLSVMVPALAPVPIETPAAEPAPLKGPESSAPVAMPIRPALPGHLAFAARLVPICAAGTPAAKPAAGPLEPAPELIEAAAASPIPNPIPGRAPARALPSVVPGVVPSVAAIVPARVPAIPAKPVLKAGDSAPAPKPSSSESDAQPTPPAPEVSPTPLAPTAAEPAPAKIDAAPPAKPERADKPQAVREPALGKPPAIARDIRFEINSPEHRVELRLIERAGEVHIAVRTPDARLAGDLRENLPTLSTRLEQVGFRTETLHAASSAAPLDTLRPMETAGSANHRASDHDSKQDPREPRDQAQHDQPQQRKHKGKEFEWLMSSLR